MKSLLFAAFLLGLFAWIHAEKVDSGVPADAAFDEDFLDTVPLNKSKSIKMKADTSFEKLQFKDSTIIRKSRDSFYRKKMLDTPLVK